MLIIYYLCGYHVAKLFLGIERYALIRPMEYYYEHCIIKKRVLYLGNKYSN